MKVKFVYPGYNYLGPEFGSDRYEPAFQFNVEPTNKLDEAAMIHDKGYAALIKKGINPYVYWNTADEVFLDTISNSNWDYGTPQKLARSFFAFKKQWAPVSDERADTSSASKMEIRKRKLDEVFMHTPKYLEEKAYELFGPSPIEAPGDEKSDMDTLWSNDPAFPTNENWKRPRIPEPVAAPPPEVNMERGGAFFERGVDYVYSDGILKVIVYPL